MLKLHGVTKRFKEIKALEDVHFEARRGEIHTLLGENGAGKSTILNIMSGALRMDSGEMFFEGEPVNIKTPLDARKLGIVKIHQELQLIPELTVYENIFLGNELLNPATKTLWFRKMKDRADELLKSLDADFGNSVPVKKLSIAQRQIVEIAKALLNQFSVLILDEPTSSLTNYEIKKLFELMRRQAEMGKAIIFVSHRLDEVFEISDRITVLRDGRYIDTLDAKGTSKETLIQLMTGRDLSGAVKNERKISDEVVLSVRNFSGFDKRFTDINFDLHRGEILGFAGLVGAGRTETMRAIFGADKKLSGQLYLYGEEVSIESPTDSMKHGIALIPEDRKLQGMVSILSNMTNVALCSLDRLAKKGLYIDKAVRENAEIYMKMLGVKPMNPNLNTENLSGGNQQKIVIAKWMSINANIIIMDEPTRGIDVGAKDEIHRLMLRLVENGVSILLISSELPEVISMSNRIMVMNEGRIAAELLGGDVTEAQILKYAMESD